MTEIPFEYGVWFGPGDASDWYEWSATVEGETEAAYLEAMKLRLPFDEFPVLNELFDEAYKKIEETEIDNFLDCDWGYDYVRECLGRYEVDPDDINDLVAKRDPYTLEFFELTDLSEEELEEWDAYDCDMPYVCDFDKDFVPTSPFESGWELNVRFCETPEEEELEEKEARKTLRELLLEAHGDYDKVGDYVSRCDSLYYSGDLEELAEQIAAELGLTDYIDEE